MAIGIPQKSAFDTAGQYQRHLQRVEKFACIFSLISTVLSFFEFYSYIKDVVIVISVILLVSICFLQMRFRSTYREAESIRRDALIDHAFGTVMADVQ